MSDRSDLALGWRRSDFEKNKTSYSSHQSLEYDNGPNISTCRLAEIAMNLAAQNMELYFD